MEKEKDFLIEDEVVLEREEETLSPEELKRREKIKKIKKYVFTGLIMSSISATIISLSLIWMWRFNLMAWTDAFCFATLLIFFAGWIMFIYNGNILSPLIHGIKSFGLFVVGKRPKLDYYHYMKKVQDEQIPKFYYRVCFITALILAIPSLILLLIVML